MISVSNAIALIDKIEELVLNSPKIPFSSRIVVDEERLFELIDKLREDMPTELEQAQQIINHKNTILTEAQGKAERIVELTKEKSRQYVQETEIVRQAEKYAEDARKSTDLETRRQRYEADKYSEEVLAALEEKVNQSLVMVQNGRQNLTRNMEMTAKKMGV